MTISSGTRLGPFEVIAPLGAGGMGEVFKAKDTRLDRLVAIKVLTTAAAEDPEFRVRFTREAKSISQLHHSNICVLHDIGREGDVDYLVMEYLEGETLAQRLDRGPLPLAQALTIGVEIAAALTRAHQFGIIHRDLKPGNVMLTKDGAKLLDFGLAKSGIKPGAGNLATELAVASPAGPVTAKGTILGTVQYMSPEQIQGQDADARSDIFSFGCVLYEMVTGTRAFAGKSSVSVMAAILEHDPAPMAAIATMTPAELDRVVRTCLAKDPDARWQCMHDLERELRWIAVMPHSAAATPEQADRSARFGRLAWATVAVLAAGLFGTGIVALQHFREAASVQSPIRFTIETPPGASFSDATPEFALSPDGKHIAYGAAFQGANVVWVRSLDSTDSRPLPGTEGARYPFWSADARSIGFFSRGKLKRIDRAGGPATDICDAPSGGGRGGTWSQDDVIVFAANASSLWKVRASGGAPVAVTTLDGSSERSHVFPHFLPDGRHFVFRAVGTTLPRLKIGSLESPSTETLLEGDSRSVLGGYSAGHLLFTRDGILMAHPFDVATRRLSGDPFPVASGVNGAASSRDGVLVYAGGSTRGMSQPTEINRQGRVLSTIGEPGEYLNVVLSPDERQLGVSFASDSPRNQDTWILDLAGRSAPLRLTFDPAIESPPYWSASSNRVVFNSNRSGFYNLYSKPASGSGPDELLLESKTHDYPNDWSRDGRTLIYSSGRGKTGFDLFTLDMATRQSSVFLETPANEDHATFSPDGRWVAYSSNATGREEVYVRSFPSTGGHYQVSRNGGMQTAWRGDGGELYFLALDGTLMAAKISTAKGFESSVPEALFKTTVALAANAYRRQFAVAKDGQSFILNTPIPRAGQPLFTVLVNWPAAAVR